MSKTKAMTKTKGKKNPKVEGYFRRDQKWQMESQKLRAILLEFPLAEELKWGKPCYVFEGNNVVLIQGFKEYCALLFFKGALLNDAQGILVRPGENTQASRQIRFTTTREIVRMKATLNAYVHEAIEVEQAGLKVQLKTSTEYSVPEEFQSLLDKKPALKKAFAALTPGRQRAYLLYFSGAKQSATRAARVQKCLPQILQRKGLND